MKKIIFLIAAAISIVIFMYTTSCKKAKSTEKQKSAVKVEFNKTGLPIVNKPIELKIVAQSAPLAPPYSKMEIVKKWEKDTNIHIKWENIRGVDYEEKKNLILASGNVPDAFYNAGLSDFDILTYSKDGTLIPLEDLIDKYAPNIKKLFNERPKLRKLVTAPDGHIYTLPQVEEMGLREVPFFMAINKKWLDKLNIPVPETPEELYKALKAFKTQDPNGNGKADEIPLSFMSDFWCSDICELFSPFGVYDNNEDNRFGHVTVVNGKVIITAAQEGYKNAIKYLHKLYKEDLINPESFVRNPVQYLATGKREPNVMGMFIWWEMPEVIGPERVKDYILLPPLKNKSGKRVVGRANISSYNKAAFAITSSNKYPEITMRWIDYIYNPKNAAQAAWGPIGTIFEENKSGKLMIKKLPDGVSMGELRQEVAPSGVGIILKEHFDSVVEMEPRAKRRLKDIEKIYAPYLREEYYPKGEVFYTADQMEDLAILEADIMPYIKAQRAKWIVYGGVEKDWNHYIDVLNRMGIKKLLNIYQAAYNSYKQN